MSDRWKQSWPRKFATAGRGIRIAVASERSFIVHLPAAIVVAVAAWYLQVTVVEWGLLILCIASVGTSELLNTAIERLAAAIDSGENSQLRDALDIASGAVLWMSVAAAVVGGMVFAAAYLRILAG